MHLAIVNTYFKKKDEHRVTYKSGGKSTQVDYVMCRRRNLKEMCNCKVILNECVAKQHRMVVCKMALMVKKKKAEKVKRKIRWWKLKETCFQEAFRQEVTRFLGGKDGLPDEWDKTAEMLRKTADTEITCIKTGLLDPLVAVNFSFRLVVCRLILHSSWYFHNHSIVDLLED